MGYEFQQPNNLGVDSTL